MTDYTLIHGDCLPTMADMEAQSVDAIIVDTPYGTTNCAWDTVIPFAPMWEVIKHVLKPRGACVMFGSQPFTSALIMSNPWWFKYQWIWHKDKATGFLDATKRPLSSYEDINLFCDGQSTYNPQMRKGKMHRRGGGQTGPAHVYGNFDNRSMTESDLYYPQRIIKFSVDRDTIHPTQKPTELLEYLIRTYTNEGDTVLDFTCGSGTTGVAALLTGRRFIGIELDETYFKVAQKRLAAASQMANGQFVTKTGTDADTTDLPLFAAE